MVPFSSLRPLATAARAVGRAAAWQNKTAWCPPARGYAYKPPPREVPPVFHEGASLPGRQRPKTSRQRNDDTLFYVLSVSVMTVGLAYGAVPLYKIFCQTTGYGGTFSEQHDGSKVKDLEPATDRPIKIQFNADIDAAMQWNFRPQQDAIEVVPGETVLAFYKAKNPTDKPIDGISTYNIVPYDAGKYFIKIQCFCFEEQRLNPHEEVDMPVFFYIDPEFANDPIMEDVKALTLSYTFFESKPGLDLPMMGSMTPPGWKPPVAAKSKAE